MIFISQKKHQTIVTTQKRKRECFKFGAERMKIKNQHRKMLVFLFSYYKQNSPLGVHSYAVGQDELVLFILHPNLCAQASVGESKFVPSSKYIRPDRVKLVLFILRPNLCAPERNKIKRLCLLQSLFCFYS